MHQIKLFSIIVLISLMSIFAIQNVAVVELQFLIWSIEIPRALLLLLVLLIGITIGYVGHALVKRYRL